MIPGRIAYYIEDVFHIVHAVLLTLTDGVFPLQNFLVIGVNTLIVLGLVVAIYLSRASMKPLGRQQP